MYLQQSRTFAEVFYAIRIGSKNIFWLIKLKWPLIALKSPKSNYFLIRANA